MAMIYLEVMDFECYFNFPITIAWSMLNCWENSTWWTHGWTPWLNCNLLLSDLDWQSTLSRAISQHSRIICAKVLLKYLPRMSQWHHYPSHTCVFSVKKQSIGITFAREHNTLHSSHNQRLRQSAPPNYWLSLYTLFAVRVEVSMTCINTFLYMYYPDWWSFPDHVVPMETFLWLHGISWSVFWSR